MNMRHRPLAVQIFSFLLVAVIALVMQAFFVRLVWAAAPGRFFAYISNYHSNTVSVIDTTYNTVVATVPVGNWPYGVAVDPTGRRAYVTNAHSHTVSVIDTYSNTVVATITVGSTPAAFGKFIVGPLVIINIAAIPGVTAPVTGATPVAAITETTQYTGTVAWSPSPADGKVAPDTAYTATITLTAKPGFTLTGVAANQFTVAGAAATNAAGSGVVTAVFPATAAATVPAAPGGWGDAAPAVPPATPVVTAPDVQRATGAIFTKGFSAAEAKQGVTVETGALKEMRDQGREVRVNTPQAAVILPPRMAQVLLGQDASSMIIVSVTPGVGDLPPPPAQLRPAGADVEVVARVKQGAREVNLEGERHLILTYDPRRVQNPSRLGVYRWEKGAWRYVGARRTLPPTLSGSDSRAFPATPSLRMYELSTTWMAIGR